MNWDKLKWIWKRLTQQFSFHSVRSDDYRARRIDRTDTSTNDRWRVSAAPPYHPDSNEKRHEYSQHIGC